ncbi:hypothetical protein D3C78_1113280 [compost metagenome]
MAVEDQRLAPLPGKRLVHADYVGTPVIGNDRRRVAGMLADLLLVDVEAIDPQAQALAEQPFHKGLGRSLLAQQRRTGHQLAEHVDRLAAQRGHTVENSCFGQLQFRIYCHDPATLCLKNRTGWGRDCPPPFPADGSDEPCSDRAYCAQKIPSNTGFC